MSTTASPALRVARDYTAKGWRVVPVKHRGKAPIAGNGWQRLRLTDADLPAHFNGAPMNVGVLLGEPSGWLVDVDLDHAEAVALAREYLPPTEATFGRKSKRGSHWLYRVSAPVETKRFRSASGATIVELRSSGAQTVFPGSVHESGEAIEWEATGEPFTVDAGELLAAVELLADEVRLLIDGADETDAENDDDEPVQKVDAEAVARADHSRKYERCLAYLEKADDAISGANGHGALWWASRCCVRFDLDETEHRRALEWFSANKSDPPWSAQEIDHKLHDAVRKFKSERGLKLIEDKKPRKGDRRKSARPSRPAVAIDTRKLADVARQLSDIGNAARLVVQRGADLRYCEAWKRWLVWDGRRWAVDDVGGIRRAAQDVALSIYAEAKGTEGQERGAIMDWADKSQRSERISAMIREAAPHLAVTPAHLDADPWLLNCGNGTLDLRTGKLGPHERADLLTKMTPVAFDPDAEDKRWGEFLRTSTNGDDDVAEFLQRAVGYALTGDAGEEVLFFIHGPAATGKSTFIEAVKTTLGDYAATADFETFLKRRGDAGIRNDIARLHGRRFVSSIEVDEGKALAEGLVKNITGGEKVSARFLYQEHFEFLPQFKLWLVANHAPRVSADDDAMWRRILRVPFDRVIPKERRDPGLKRHLRDPGEAGPAILAWAVRGCLEWRRRGGLAVPLVIERATHDYRTDNDVIGKWWGDCCEQDAGSFTPSAALYASYKRWCEDEGIRPVGGRKLADWLKAHGCEDIRDTDPDDGKRKRGYVGVRLLFDPRDSCVVDT